MKWYIRDEYIYLFRASLKKSCRVWASLFFSLSSTAADAAAATCEAVDAFFFSPCDLTLADLGQAEKKEEAAFIPDWLQTDEIAAAAAAAAEGFSSEGIFK